MAPPRLSATPPVPAASAETWAVRISIGLMMVGMAGFVVYDLVSPGPSTASASTEAEGKAEETTEGVPDTMASPATEKRSGTRTNRTRNLTMPTRSRVQPSTQERATEEEGSGGDNARDRSSLRSFLGTPRLTPQDDDRGGMMRRPFQRNADRDMGEAVREPMRNIRSMINPEHSRPHEEVAVQPVEQPQPPPEPPPAPPPPQEQAPPQEQVEREQPAAPPDPPQEEQ